MKLPPICADLPPFENPDITNRNPPSAAEKTPKRPNPDTIRTLFAFDQTKDKAKITIARNNKKIPSNVCQDQGKTKSLNRSKKSEQRKGWWSRASQPVKKIFTVSPNHP